MLYHIYVGWLGWLSCWIVVLVRYILVGWLGIRILYPVLCICGGWMELINNCLELV